MWLNILECSIAVYLLTLSSVLIWKIKLVIDCDLVEKKINPQIIAIAEFQDFLINHDGASLASFLNKKFREIFNELVIHRGVMHNTTTLKQLWLFNVLHQVKAARMFRNLVDTNFRNFFIYLTNTEAQQEEALRLALELETSSQAFLDSCDDPQNSDYERASFGVGLAYFVSLVIHNTTHEFLSHYLPDLKAEAAYWRNRERATVINLVPQE